MSEWLNVRYTATKSIASYFCYNVTQQDFTPVLFNEKNTELDKVLDKVYKTYK